MTLEQLAASIAHNIGKPHDYALKKRLEYEIVSKRATLIKRELDKNKRISGQFVQEVRCIATTTTDQSECGNTNVTIRKTNVDVPRPIKSDGFSGFLYVGGISKSDPYGLIVPEEVPFLMSGSCSREATRYAYMNDRIYIYGSNPTEITIRGIFEDPREVEKMNGVANCQTDASIDLPAYMEDTIKDMIYKELRAMMLVPNEIKPNETSAG
jgi:hypothetical protein